MRTFLFFSLLFYNINQFLISSLPSSSIRSNQSPLKFIASFSLFSNDTFGKNWGKFASLHLLRIDLIPEILS